MSCSRLVCTDSIIGILLLQIIQHSSKEIIVSVKSKIMADQILWPIDLENKIAAIW